LENIKSDLSTESYLEIQEKSALIPEVLFEAAGLQHSEWITPWSISKPGQDVENLGSHEIKIIKKIVLLRPFDNESQASLQIAKLS